MPRVITAPVRTRRSQRDTRRSAADIIGTTPFHEKEIERNRVTKLTSYNGTGYGKEEFTKGSGKRPATSTSGCRLKDGWTYGVTYYLP